MDRALVFSFGFNGYQYVYQPNIATHRAYCERRGMHYEFLSKPMFAPMRAECVWVKLSLISAALDEGWPWVAYIDSDIEVKPDCPDFRSLEVPGKSLYMVNGYSERLNSGVIIVKNTPQARHLFQRILASASTKLPPGEDVWGENGHIIHFATRSSQLQVISSRWNNNHDPALADYLRHYSAGPMRALYPMNIRQKFWGLVGRVYLKLSGLRPSGQVGDERFYADLTLLHAAATRGVTAFGRPQRRLDAVPELVD